MSCELKTQAEPIRSLYINALYGNSDSSVDLRVLVDCGASLLSRNALQKIPQKIHPALEQSETKVKFVDGSIQSANGSVNLNLKVGDKTNTVNFLVGDFKDDAKLGMHDL